MKTIRLYLFMMLLAASVVCMTGCGDKNNQDQSSSSANQTTQSNTSAGMTGDSSESSSGTSTGGSQSESGSSTESSSTGESSTGVIGGLMDDVEKGVEDLTGNGTDTSSNAADESSR